ncbi:MAG TPA: hypothetical protein V6D23_01485 [Candidatus Obscuribacterales bacterium]
MNNENPDSSASRRRFSLGSFALGLLLGAAAGAATALLLAPAAGAETRAQIKAKVSVGQGHAGKIADEGSAQIKSYAGDFGSLLGAKLALLRQAFEAGKQAAMSKHQQLSKLESVETAREAAHG